MGIVRTDDVLGSEPRLEGRRVSVLQVAERVLTHGQSPEYVADQIDLSLAEIHRALSYYYDNVDEMNELRERQGKLEDMLEDVATAPPETAER